MDWIIIAVLAHFLTALAVIIDKFLLASKRVGHPSTYAFYTGALSIFTLVLAPWGFHWMSTKDIALSFISGIIFIYGILFVFKALRDNEASRVNPVVGTTVPIVAFIFASIFLSEDLNRSQLIGVVMLILGGWVIAWEFDGKNKGKLFGGFFQAVIAGVFLAFAFSFFKVLYLKDTFINIFIWTRLGLVLGSLSLLLFPAWKKIITGSFSGFKKPEKKNYRTGFLFTFNKIIAGVGSILLNYAISIGSVTIVNALTVMEYAFVFILGSIFSFFMPQVFHESRDARVRMQKIIALAIIAVGLWLVAQQTI
jgi:uncharacterized membrane protein